MWRTGARWLVLLVLGSSVAISSVIPDIERVLDAAGVDEPAPSRKAKAKPATPAKPARPRAIPIPDDAIRLALEDLPNVHPYARPFTRWLFVRNADKRSMKTTSLLLGYLSHSTGIHRPVPVAGGVLLRLDLRLFAPAEREQKEWLRFWEEFAFDSDFSRIITKDQVDFAGPPEPIGFRTAKRFTFRRGRRPDGSIGRIGSTFEVQVPIFPKGTLVNVKDAVRFNSRAIDPVALGILQRITNSEAPVVDHRYWKFRVLTTIKDAKVFARVFGGLYYEFAGVRKAVDVLGANTRATDLDLFFEDLGIGNIKGGLTAEGLFAKLRSDQAVAMEESKVTGKPREVTMHFTPATRHTSPWGAISGDVKDQDIDIGDIPAANLLTPRREAREAIFPKLNGFHRFALFNGVGARQDDVPPDIANDTTIPAPHTQRLQAMRGCIFCHNLKGGTDGWQPLQNDVKAAIDRKRKYKLDIFDDRGGRVKVGGRMLLRSEVLDRLAGRYAGDFTDNLAVARDSLARVTLLATGPWEESEDQTDVCAVSARHLEKEFNSFWYSRVDAKQALYELGLEVESSKEANNLFERLIPPDLRALRADGTIPEDVRIGNIASGIGIKRSSFALVRDYMAERLRRSPLWHKLRERERSKK